MSEKRKPGRPKQTIEEKAMNAQKKREAFLRRCNYEGKTDILDIKFDSGERRKRIKDGLLVAPRGVGGKKMNDNNKVKRGFLDMKKPTVTEEELKEFDRYGLREDFLNNYITHIQTLFLMELMDNPMNISRVLRRVGYRRQSYEEARVTNPVFRMILENISEEVIDTVENSVYELAKGGNIKAAELILRAKAKNRGYGSQQDEVVRVVSEIEVYDLNEDGEMLDDSALIAHFDMIEDANNKDNDKDEEDN